MVSTQRVPFYPFFVDQESLNLGNNNYNFTYHATEERLRKNISTNAVCEIIVKGTIAKTEKDEKTGGKLKKYTVDWKNFRVVIKNDEPPLIISIRVKNK